MKYITVVYTKELQTSRAMCRFTVAVLCLTRPMCADRTVHIGTDDGSARKV